MSKLKKRMLIALTLFCSFFALVACSENKIADKPENSAVYDQAKVLSKETIKKLVTQRPLSKYRGRFQPHLLR